MEEVEAYEETKGSGAVRAAKDLTAGATGGIAQVLLGWSHFSFLFVVICRVLIQFSSAGQPFGEWWKRRMLNY